MTRQLILNYNDYHTSPLSPVLPWCREKLSLLNEEELSRFLTSCSIPSTHGTLFFNYFRGIITTREKWFSLSEKEYNRRVVYRSLEKIFSALLRKEEIESLQIKASGTMTRLTRRFLDNLASSPWGYEGLITVENKGEIFSWDGLSLLPSFSPALGEIEDGEVFELAMTYHIFGDHIPACQLFRQLYAKARSGVLNLDIQQRARLFSSYSRSASSIYLYDLALTVAGSLLNLGQAWDNKAYKAQSYRLTGEVYYLNNFPRTASRFFRKSLNESGDDGELRFHALFALTQLDGEPGIRGDEAEELINLMDSDEREIEKAVVLTKLDPPDWDGAEAIARKEGDPLIISRILCSRASYALAQGHMEEGEKNYKESLKLAREIDNLPLINRCQYNLGLYYQKGGEYRLSFAHFRKALNGFLKTESYEKMARTYYDLAFSALLLHHIPLVISCLESTLYITHRIHLPTGELEERSQALMGLAYLVGRNYSDARLILEKIQEASDSLTVLFREIISFVLEGENRNYEAKAREWAERFPHREGYDFLLSLFIRDDEKEKETSLQWFDDPLDRELVAASLKQYRRVDQLKKKMREMNLISGLQIIFNRRLDREFLILHTMERLVSSFLFSTVTYFENLEDSYRLAYHSSTFDTEPDRSVLGRYLAGEEGKKRKSTALVSDDNRPGPDDILCLPVYSGDEEDGLILCRLVESTLMGEGEENDRQFLSILSGQFGTALEQIKQREMIIRKNRQLEAVNRELMKTSLTDPLTGIGNRKQLDEKIEYYSKKYDGSRESDNYTLMFIDLDFFKYYNDTFGHALGDRLLEEFTRLLKTACRDSDMIFRYGGDEFIVLLAGIDSVHATLIADRILEELKTKKGFTSLIRDLGFGNVQIPEEKFLGCSIGLSDYRKSGKKESELLKQADKALYKAKESGKKRWIIYDEETCNE